MKNEFMMTNPKNFGHMANNIKETIVKNEGLMPEYRVMEILKLSPTSWNVWKPHLLQKFLYEDYKYTDGNGEVKLYKIEYKKKEKLFQIKLPEN